MKFKKIKIGNFFYHIIIILASYVVAFYITESLMLSLAFSIIVILGYIYLLRYKKKDSLKYHRINASYNFVNLLNVQMLSTSNVYEAYQGIENYVDVDFSSMSNDDMTSILQTLSEDYKLNSFKMYVNTLILYISEGGDFKELEKIPTSLCQKCKVYYDGLKKEKASKLAETSVLYLLFVAIIAFVKFSIKDYYEAMLENITYQIALFAILSIGYFFYYLSLRIYFINDIKGL